MKLRMMLVMGLAVFSLGLLPAVGTADGPDYQPEGPNYQPNTRPQGPKSAPKGKAYGYYCRGESKKHVKGEKGTAVQPLRESDGAGGQERRPDREESLQGAEQEARQRRREGDAVQPLRQRRQPAAAGRGRDGRFQLGCLS